MTDKPKGARKPRTAADIQAEIARHEAKKVAAAAEVTALLARRPPLVLDLSEGADDRLDAIDKAVEHARRVAPRVDAATQALNAELAALAEAEEQARRETLYAEGLAAAAEHLRLSGEYNKAARAVVAVLDAMERQKAIIDRANDRLPVATPMAIHRCDEHGEPRDYVRLPGALGEPDPYYPRKW